MKFPENMRRFKKNIYIIFIIVLCGFFFYHTFTICYYINDDSTMRNIASGAYTGIPDGHLIFIKYALGYVMSIMYQVIPSVEWYGLILFSLHFICLGFILSRVLTLLNRKNMVVLCASTLLIFMVIDIPHIVSKFQFTTTAAICAATALFLFVSMPKGLTGKAFFLSCIPTVLLAVISFCIRSNVFLMILPFAAVLWIYRLFLEKDVKGAAKRLIIFATVVAILVGVVMIIEQIAYSSDQWKEYKEFNSARSQILDYTGYPDYETHREVYEELEISREEYDLLLNSVIRLSPDLTIDKYVKLAEYSKELYICDHPLRERISDIIADTVDYSMNIMHSGGLAVALVLYLFLFFRSLCRKDYQMVFLLFIVFVFREIIYFYLIMQARFPDRISDSLLLCDYAIVAGLFFYLNILETIRFQVDRFVVPIISLFLAGTAVLTLIPYHSYRNPASEDTDGIVNKYCTDNELNGRYVLDGSGFDVGKDEFRFKAENNYINYLTMYGWTCNSALYMEKADKMGMLNLYEALLEKDVYLIETGNAKGIDIASLIINYYSSTGHQVGYNEVDQIYVGSGTYKVLKFYIVS